MFNCFLEHDVRKAPFHSSFNALILVGRKRTPLLFVKSRGVQPGGVVHRFIGWVDYERVDINWEVSPVSFPCHRVKLSWRIQ